MPSLCTVQGEDVGVHPRQQFLAQIMADNDSMTSMGHASMGDMPSLSSIQLDDSMHTQGRMRDSFNSMTSSEQTSVNMCAATSNRTASPEKLNTTFVDPFTRLPLGLDKSMQGIVRETLSPVIFETSKKRLDWEQIKDFNTKDAPPSFIARPLDISQHDMMSGLLLHGSAVLSQSHDEGCFQHKVEKSDTNRTNNSLSSPGPSIPQTGIDSLSTPTTSNTKKTVGANDKRSKPFQEAKQDRTAHASGDSPPRVARRRSSNGGSIS
ncbi:MAG: hypothetical protein SGILL_010231 [Bacillariaceae sp.]